MKNNLILLSIINFWKFATINIRIRIIIAPLLIIFAGILEAQNVVLLKPLVISLTNESDQYGSYRMIITFIIVTVLTSFAKSINFFNNIKITTGLGSLLPINFFQALLRVPYTRYSKVGSGTYIDILNVKVTNIIRSIINPYLQFLSSLVSAIFVIVYILNTDFYLSLILLLIVLSSYLLIALIANPIFNKISNKLSISSDTLNNVAYESLNNLRELKLMNLEDNYFNKLKFSASKYWKFYGSGVLLQTLPRYALESIFLTSIALIMLILYQLDSSLQVFIASLSSLALGAQRLIPAFQNIYDSYASFTTYQEDLKIYLNTYRNLLEKNKTNFSEFVTKGFSKGSNLLIKMDNISFSYESKFKKGFDQINFEISKGDLICIKGPSGGGKSTFLDLISLLLVPDSGNIQISKDLFINSYSLSMGYVSQQDFLFNDSLIYNICFKNAEDMSKKDMQKLKNIIKIVCLEDTISNLSLGISTLIGENGNLLSGGQKQRLAIARALFKEPKLLIMDESTSRLDELLEKKIMDNLRKVKGLTIILVSHRSTLNNTIQKRYLIKNWKITKEI